VATGPPGEVGGEGGAAAPSAAELAAELSNPVSLNVAPVVKNGLAGWFGLGRD
jgi:hypothetical protein